MIVISLVGEVMVVNQAAAGEPLSGPEDTTGHLFSFLTRHPLDVTAGDGGGQGYYNFLESLVVDNIEAERNFSHSQGKQTHIMILTFICLFLS